MASIRTLLIGDITEAPWHPLEPARVQLESILGEPFDLDSTEDYERLAGLDKEQYPLCISYTDCWDRDISSEIAAGLLRYVASGGGLLVIHNGISLQVRYELLQMIGGKFTEHPPYQTLHYYGTDAEHPLLKGVDDFVLDEEPYHYELDPFTPRNVFLEYEFEGRRYPAGWEHTYGLGRVVYIQPGHHSPSFDSPAVRQLIVNGANWCAARSWRT